LAKFSTTRLPDSDETGANTGLVVSLVEVKQQNFVIEIVTFFKGRSKQAMRFS
jgi:hypothetical protein